MKKIYFLGILFFYFSCGVQTHDTTKTLDLKSFEITVPENWDYKKEKGIDSYVGRIEGNGTTLYFDFSIMGYSSSLIDTKEEYVFKKEWKWMPISPCTKRGIYYTTGSVSEYLKEIMETKGIKDSALIKVKKMPTYEKKVIKEGEIYKAIITCSDTILRFDINIPDELLKHKIQVDTINGYYRKLVNPNYNQQGLTGVYFKHLSKSLTFNMYGENLSVEDQQKALKAFKTIQIKTQ